MKKLILFIVVVIALVSSAFYIDNQLERGIVEELEYHILPDPMASNRYARGQCTFYVFDQIRLDGNMIESSWYHAKYWAERAEDDGYLVNNTPKKGSILHTPDYGALGHVAYVESINEDGSLEVSEMNYIKPYEITTRVIDSNEVEDYAYIHPKENPRPKSLENH